MLASKKQEVSVEECENIFHEVQMKGMLMYEEEVTSISNLSKSISLRY